MIYIQPCTVVLLGLVVAAYQIKSEISQSLLHIEKWCIFLGPSATVSGFKYIYCTRKYDRQLETRDFLSFLFFLSSRIPVATVPWRLMSGYPYLEPSGVHHHVSSHYLGGRCVSPFLNDFF